MAKITRTMHKVFGGLGAVPDFAKFGSFKAGGLITSKDIATIQELPAWDNGFQDALYGANRVLPVEDLNGFAFEHSTMIGYALQEGISEWDAGTAYYAGSIVKKSGTLECYASITNANVGNALPAMADNSSWRYLGRTTGDAPSVGTVPKFDAFGRLVSSLATDDGSKVSVAGQIESTVAGFKFPDGTVQARGASTVTVQSTFPISDPLIVCPPGSRTYDIPFYNPPTSTARIVAITCFSPLGVFIWRNLAIFCDAGTSGSPSTRIGTATPELNGGVACITFVVPPGYRYLVSGRSSEIGRVDIPILYWVEWS